jgi:hypothetical protein
MARTLNARWLAAFRQAQVRPVVLVSITVEGRSDSPTDDVVFSWVSGDAPLFGHPCSIAGLSSFGVEVDPLSREASVGSITVTFVDDGTLRAVALAHPLKNRRMTISLGTPDLALAEWERIASELRIDDVLPQRGSIEVVASDTKTEPLDQAEAGFEFPGHPWRIMQAILRRRRGVGAGLAPDASFAIPASATSHFVVSRHNAHTSPEDNVEHVDAERERPSERLQQLAEISYTVLRTNELGESEVVAWDPAPAGGGSFALTSEDYADIDQPSAYEDIVTRIVCDHAIGLKGGTTNSVEIEPRYSAQDVEAQETLRGPYWGNAPAVYERAVSSVWLNAGCYVGGLFPGATAFAGGTLSAAATSLTVPHPLWHGFCGTLTTDAGAAPRNTGSLAPTATYGSPNSGTLYDPLLGVQVIGADYMRDAAASWIKAAIEATYTSPGVYSASNLLVIWYQGATALGSAVVTSASTDGKWLRFEAIAPSLALSIGTLAASASGTVTYEVRLYSSSIATLSSSIDAAQQVTALRPGYILLIDRATLESEIIKTTAFAYDTTKSVTSKRAVGYSEPDRPGEAYERAFWREGTFTIERGALGTTAKSFGGTTWAFDVTIAEWLSRQILERARYGIPRLVLRLPLDRLGIEIGDIGTVSTDLFLAHEASGDGGRDRAWEVISREIDLLSESPGITLTLATSYMLQTAVSDIEHRPGTASLRPLFEVYIDNTAIPYRDNLSLEYTTRY